MCQPSFVFPNDSLSFFFIVISLFPPFLQSFSTLSFIYYRFIDSFGASFKGELRQKTYANTCKIKNMRIFVPK